MQYKDKFNDFNKLPDPNCPDTRNKLLLTAEHEIRYSAKRAIEMFLPVWDKDKSFTMFHICTQHYCLCQGEAEKCKSLMIKFGFTDKLTI